MYAPFFIQQGDDFIARPSKYNKDFVVKFLEPLKLKLKDLEYINVGKKMEIECEKNHIFFRSFHKFLLGIVNCPHCTNRKTFKKYEQSYVLDVIQSLNYKFLDSHYRHKNTPMKLECENGHIFFRSFKYLLENKINDCPSCSNRKVNNKKYNLEEVREYLSSINIRLKESEYKSNKINLKVECEEGHTFFRNLIKFKKGKTQCPVCWRIECSLNGYLVSKSEKECRKIIEDLTGFRFPSSRPPFLSDGRNHSKTLQLDGYNEDIKVAFEYDGEQHYMPIDIFGGEDHFIKQKQRDLIKDKLCVENGVRLLRIPYFIEDRVSYIRDWLIVNNIISG